MIFFFFFRLNGKEEGKESILLKYVVPKINFKSYAITKQFRECSVVYDVLERVLVSYLVNFFFLIILFKIDLYNNNYLNG